MNKLEGHYSRDPSIPTPHLVWWWVVPISILTPLPGGIKIPKYRPGVVRWVLYIREWPIPPLGAAEKRGLFSRQKARQPLPPHPHPTLTPSRRSVWPWPVFRLKRPKFRLVVGSPHFHTDPPSRGDENTEIPPWSCPLGGRAGAG